MGNRTERDLSPDPREMGRRRFMIAGEHVIWVSRSAWFGLFIGEPSAWNRGYGGDAIRTLSRFAFDEVNLMKLSIRVFEYNDRAKHVPETLGFVREGCLQRDFYREGSYHDIVLYSMFREQK